MATPVEPFRRQFPDGKWVGSLICLPFLGLLIFFAVQAAHQHRWGKLAGFALIALILVSVPAGGLKWLRGAGKDSAGKESEQS